MLFIEPDICLHCLCSSWQSRSSAASRHVSPSIGDVSGDEIDSVVATSMHGDGTDDGTQSGMEDAVPAAANFIDMEVEESDGQEWYCCSLSFLRPY